MDPGIWDGAMSGEVGSQERGYQGYKVLPNVRSLSTHCRGVFSLKGGAGGFPTALPGSRAMLAGQGIVHLETPGSPGS